MGDICVNKREIILTLFSFLLLVYFSHGSLIVNVPSVNMQYKYVEKEPIVNSSSLDLFSHVKKSKISQEFKRAVEELWKKVVKKSRPIYGR